jgi:hypothetical protein
MWHDGTCDTCDQTRQVIVRALPGIAMSTATCRPCHTSGAIPLWVAVANTAALDGMEHAAPWWHETVETTLKHLNVPRVEFDAHVRHAMGLEPQP